MLKFSLIDTDVVEEILNEVKVSEDGCYLYPFVDNNGYGKLQKRGQHLYAHRVMKSFSSNVDLKSEDVVHHTCGTKNCVNPAHLRVMTYEDHNKLHNTKLSERDIYTILDSYFVNSELTLKALSDKLKDEGIDVNFSYISQLVNNKVRQEAIRGYLMSYTHSDLYV